MEKPHFPIKLNYLYFGSFLIFLLLISASGIFIKEQIGGLKFFFFLYATGQALLEITLFIFCGWIIQRFLGKIGFAFFIGGTFIFFILHLIDFIVERILDLSIWQTLAFLLDESLENFWYLLDASGIPFWMWGVFFCLLLLLPFLGIALYHVFEKITKHRPLFLKKEWFFEAFICLPVALLLWEYSSSQLLHPNYYTGLVKSLPWKFTFLQPQTVFFPLSNSLKEPLSEETILSAIEKDETHLNSKPNIYLFVVESFREDFITPEVAPYLSQFKQQANHFDTALSNANGSHLSWFSIFHSQFPYCWNHLQKKGWTMGSPPIHLLKKWGYQVRLYSSAQLNYYGMEELLFGKNRQLLDSFQTFHHAPPLLACDSDAQALNKLQEDLKNPELQQGQLIVVFWDSTHFDYSSPKTSTPKFSPIAGDFAYFQLFHSSENIEKIKNKYRNAVFYIDSLFEKFMNNLPQKEEAIVVITGDHGEEFFEHGNLFHCSHIVHEQTHIPLYMKFGDKKLEPIAQLVSQMDIFPSILHYLSNKKISFLEGASIWDTERWPYTLIARFNAGRTPYEFCIHNGHHKFIAQFTDKKNIFQSRELKIKSICNHKDVHLYKFPENMNEWINSEFGQAFQRIFKE